VPAAASGAILPGDEIVAVNGKDVAGWDNLQLRAAIANNREVALLLRGASRQTQ
jgi:hypothetical protein